MEASALNTQLFSPVLLLATGALAAIVLMLVVFALRRVGNDTKQWILPVATLFVVGLAAVFIADRLSVNEQAADRRALEQRETMLAAQALGPNSVLGCLDSAAGEVVDTACENAVFADPQSVAAAVAYVSARLALLGDGLEFARKSDPGFAAQLAGLQRSIELDRFGIAAHILSSREGCTAERCPAFALLRDASALKANLRVGAYRDYVARHAAAWKNGAPGMEKEPPVARNAPASAAAPAAVASLPGAPPNAPSPSNPVPSRFDFPSAASIPPVSIMNPEPPLPPGAASANAAAPAPGGEASAAVPMPPRKPPAQQPAAAAPPQQILPPTQ